MIGNYFKTILRNLVRNKVFSLINIAGLGIGLTCCILILLYAKDELSYDRFHENAGRLYQLTCDRLSTKEEDKHFAIAAMVQGPAFKEEVPGIEAFTRVSQKPFVVRKDNQTFNETGTWVDDNFFSVFSFPLMSGNPAKALSDLHDVVLTEETAKKYFGSFDVIGKKLEIEIGGKFEPFIVSAVTHKAPQNSSIRFNILLPFKYLETTSPDNGWMWVSYPTYLLLNENVNTNALSAKMNQVFAERAKNELAENKLLGYNDKFIWGVYPFVKMHLNSHFEGVPEPSDPIYSYVLSGIAVFVLLIACINFINLTVAQSMRRSRYQKGNRRPPQSAYGPIPG